MTIINEEMQLWFHYEEVAMHFNQLIIQYRLQLVGGAGVIGALASYLVQQKVSNRLKRYELHVVVSLVLFLVVSAAASLDIFYYNKLLQGAVDALMEYEKRHPDYYMSTKIEASVTGRGMTAIWCAYLAILLPLLLFTIKSYISYRSEIKRIKRRARRSI